MIDPIIKALTLGVNGPTGIIIDDLGFVQLKMLMREALMNGIPDDPTEPGPHMLLGVPITMSKWLRPGTFMIDGVIYRWRTPTLDEMVEDAKQRLEVFIDELVARNLAEMSL